MPLLRLLGIGAVLSILSACTLPYALISATQSLFRGLTDDYSFQRLHDVAWDGDSRRLYLLYANRNGVAIYAWDQSHGVRQVRQLPELGEGSNLALDVDHGRLLITLIGSAIVTAPTVQDPLRWVPITNTGFGIASWDEAGRVVVSTYAPSSCNEVGGVWRGFPAWDKPERISGNEAAWGATLSPSRRGMAFGYTPVAGKIGNHIRIVMPNEKIVSWPLPMTTGSALRWGWLGEDS